MPYVLAFAGPSAADRAQMFNAVSRATTELADLTTLFNANQALWQQAQKTLAGAYGTESKPIAEAPGAKSSPGDAADLAARVKYASEASNAMRVGHADLIPTAAE